ncbi:MAG: ATP-binding protein, partial [Bacteroidota bacterium]
ELDSTLPDHVIGDEVRLQQILINLINNAIKFTSEGSITINVHCFILQNNCQNIEFKIIDTGIGISEEQQLRLFNAFEQADDSTTRKYGGTGLGLSIAFELVKLMQGELKVKSELGHGSEFNFSIPLKTSEQLATEMDDHHFNLPANKRILLAEDNEINQVVLSTILRQYECQVEIAKDGEEALNLFIKNQYDLVIMDLQMPNMDGYEAISGMRKSEELTKASFTPKIALTANADIQERNSALASGFDDFLTKPIDLPTIEKALFKFLSTHGAESTI